MNNKFLLAALGALVLVGGSSCSKKLGQFKSEYFSLNPEPLEVQGQNVPATVAARIPAKFMVKNAQVQVTPVLVYASGETPSAPYLIQGENVRANGAVINYLNGGSVMIPFNVAYTPAMAKSSLYLDFAVDQNGKNTPCPE